MQNRNSDRPPFLPKVSAAQRYAIAGAGFGILFPIIGTLIRMATSGFPFGIIGALDAQASDPVLWIVDIAPFVLGIFAGYIGRRQDIIQELSFEMERRQGELELIRNELELRVSERSKALERRTTELETVAEVARDITTYKDAETLLSAAVDLIRERFGYYHAGIFLVDDRNEYAVLRAASGIAGQKMLENRHRLKVGESGIVGYVTSIGQPRVSRDVGLDSVYYNNPYLPETNSELAVPLRSRNKIIGAIDIQSRDPDAFPDETIKVFQLLADQLVAAIESAELVQQVENTLRELRSTYREQTERSWTLAAQSQGRLALEYDGLQIRPIPKSLSITELVQLEHGKAITTTKKHLASDNIIDSTQDQSTLLVPLLLFDQVIGVVGIENEDPKHEWSPEEIAIAEAAANRAAVALENARLLEESQRRASKERTISEITSKIGSYNNRENILQTAVSEIGRRIPGAEVIVQLQKKQD